MLALQVSNVDGFLLNLSYIYFIEESAAIENGHNSIIFENYTGKKD